MTILLPPHNYVPSETWSDRYVIHRVITPIWRGCYKGGHDAPFHVEVEVEIGSNPRIVGAVWTCSSCGYRYPPGCEPEAYSLDWHVEQLVAALAAGSAEAGAALERRIAELILGDHDFTADDVGDDHLSMSALNYWHSTQKEIPECE